MGQLTDQLSSPSGGKPVIGPAPLAANPIVEIASTVGGLFQGQAQRDQRQRQKEQATREAITFNQGQADRSAENQLAQGLFPQTEYGTIPPAINTQAAGVAKVQTAEDQGRVPPGTAAIHVDSLISNIISEHPDSAAAVLDAVHSKFGLDSLVLRTAKDAIAAQKNQTEDQNNIESAAVKAWGGHGGDPNAPRAQQIAGGSQWIKIEAQLAIQKQQVDLITATDTHTKFEQDQKTYNLNQAHTDLRGAILDWGRQQAGSTVEEALGVVNQAVATGDPAKMDRVTTELYPVAHASLESARVRAHDQAIQAGDTTPETGKAIDDYFSGLDSSLLAATTGDVAANKLALERMQTGYGLKANRAMPIFGQTSAILGKDFTLSLFGDHPQELVGQPVVDELKKGLGVIANPTTSDAQSRALSDAFLSNLKGIIKGDTSISSIMQQGPEQARQAVAGMALKMDGSATDIAKAGKDADPTQLKEYGNTYSQFIISGTIGITPNSRDIGSMWNYSRIAFSPKSKDATEAMMNSKDSEVKQQGNEVMLARRDSAQQVLETAKTAGPTQDLDGIWNLQFDAKSNRMVVYADKVAFDKRKAAIEDGEPPVNVPGYALGSVAGLNWDQFKNQPPQFMVQQRDTMNTTADALVYTDYADPNMKGTPADRYRFYLQGTPIPGMERHPASANDQFDTNLNNVEDKFKALPVVTTTAPESRADAPAGRHLYIGAVNESAQHYNVPPVLADALFGYESGYDPHADSWKNPDFKKFPQALGLGQFQEATGKQYGLMTAADRQDPAKAIPAALHLLSDLHTKYGSWAKAFEHYGTTAGASKYPSIQKTKDHIENLIKQGGFDDTKNGNDGQ